MLPTTAWCLISWDGDPAFKLPLCKYNWGHDGLNVYGHWETVWATKCHHNFTTVLDLLVSVTSGSVSQVSLYSKVHWGLYLITQLPSYPKTVERSGRICCEIRGWLLLNTEMGWQGFEFYRYQNIYRSQRSDSVLTVAFYPQNFIFLLILRKPKSWAFCALYYKWLNEQLLSEIYRKSFVKKHACSFGCTCFGISDGNCIENRQNA